MLARLLLRVGVPSRDAERALREAFVETASLEFGIRGRSTNLSRVAMLTGLDRREVARVRARLDARSPEAGDESHPLGQVLAGWYEDPDFSGADGPRALALEAVGGDGRAGLPQLFSRYAPGLPPVAVRKELVIPKIVKQLDKRGWTEAEVKEVLRNPFTAGQSSTRSGEPVTVFYRRDGSYVVINNREQTVIQLSNRRDPNFIPDRRIINPYRPGPPSVRAGRSVIAPIASVGLIQTPWKTV